MKIVVTGAAGYIGRVLCPMLELHGHEVRGLDLRQGLGVEPFNVVSEELPLEGVDAVIPLAGYVGPKCEETPFLAKAVNQRAAESLAKRLDGRRCIVLTTDSGYLPGDKAHEAGTFEPKSVYAKTKAAGASALFDAGATVFRLASLFGVSPEMRDDLLLHFLVKHVVKTGMLPAIRGAEIRRSFVHVRDVCEAVVDALECIPPEKAIYNLTGPDRLTKADVALAIALTGSVMGYTGPAEPNDDLDARDFWLDGRRWGVCPTPILSVLPVLFDYYQKRNA